MITSSVTVDGVAEVIVDNPPVNALPAAGWSALAATLSDLGAGLTPGSTKFVIEQINVAVWLDSFDSGVKPLVFVYFGLQYGNGFLPIAVRGRPEYLC